MLLTVCTATDFPVDLNRLPDPAAVPRTAGAMGGTFVTGIDITSPQAFGRHCQQHVPPSPNRPPGAWPRYVSEIQVPDQGLQADPHGAPPAGWIPPGTPGAIVICVWEVIEYTGGSIAIVPLPGGPP